MTIVYKQHDGIDCIEELRHDYLCVTYKSMNDFKDKKENERKTWINRYNELSKEEKADRWGKLCEYYAQNAVYAMNTAKEISTNEEYDKMEHETYIKEPKEISKKLYYDMLECLPPCYKKGIKGFYMSERLSGSYTHNFYKENNKYYVKVIDLKDKKTW